MSNDKLRRQIAYEAARMLVAGQESLYSHARLQAARRVASGWVGQAELPTYQEIRDQVQTLARMQEGGPPPAALGTPQDRFAVYRALLAPLETVHQNPESHPEGDALYHSLQVFQLARDAQPYDEEFQLAALLHDVGKAIDPRDHVSAALTALDGHITQRTRWLIEHHGLANQLHKGTLGARARRRLETSEDFDDLVLLGDCDRQGRQRGVQVPDIEHALEQVRELAQDDQVEPR